VCDKDSKLVRLHIARRNQLCTSLINLAAFTGIPFTPPFRSLIIFGRPLHPDEGLNVDQVLGSQSGQVEPDLPSETQQALIGWPGRMGLVVEIESVGTRRSSGYSRFQENMGAGLRPGIRTPLRSVFFVNRTGVLGPMDAKPGARSGFFKAASAEHRADEQPESVSGGGATGTNQSRHCDLQWFGKS
jgi:hypothetical protein